MSSKTSKIIVFTTATIVVLATIIGVYFAFNSGRDRNKLEFDQNYYLTEIRPTERFKGAEINTDSYFRINADQTTGELCLIGLEPSCNNGSNVIPFIVTNYQAQRNQTIIDFAFILYSGENGVDTKIQRLQATCVGNTIHIKSVEASSVQDVISQKAEDIKSLEYPVTLFVFQKEVAA